MTRSIAFAALAASTPVNPLSAATAFTNSLLFI